MIIDIQPHTFSYKKVALVLFITLYSQSQTYAFEIEGLHLGIHVEKVKKNFALDCSPITGFRYLIPKDSIICKANSETGKDLISSRFLTFNPKGELINIYYKLNGNRNTSQFDQFADYFRKERCPPELTRDDTGIAYNCYKRPNLLMSIDWESGHIRKQGNWSNWYLKIERVGDLQTFVKHKRQKIQEEKHQQIILEKSRAFSSQVK